MTSPEEPRVPWYIDQNARHRPRTARMLAYMALAGREGVLNSTDLAVTPLATPGPFIRCAPGAFGVLNTAVGGAYEAYVDKFTSTITRAVSPTDATVGGRTDLVICRIKNPHAPGTGNYPIPDPPQDGPYWDIDVIEGVTPNINSVKAHNPAWSAITLARITRPPNTGIVLGSHITDLRSLVDLSGERIIIIDNPPADPPPIAQQTWTESTPITNYYEFPSSQGNWTDFPEASWKVPIPSWAAGMDVNILLNPVITGSVWGQMRLVVEGEPTGAVPTEYDINFNTNGPGQTREILMIGGTESLKKSWCGKVATMKLQIRSSATDWVSAHPGKIVAGNGMRINVWLNFKRVPNYADGG